jgi:hypothetical protein
VILIKEKRLVQKRRSVAEGMELFAGSEIGNTVELKVTFVKEVAQFLAGVRETKQVNGGRPLT